MTLIDSDTIARLATVPLLLGLLGNTGCPTEPVEDNVPPDTSNQVLGDYGDAPDGYPTRYSPGDGVAGMGSFPSDAHVTVLNSAFLGDAVTGERGVLDPDDGDGTHNMTDDDRHDDGIVGLRALTVTSVSADVRITAAPDAPTAGWFLNVLLDANGDGEWAPTPAFEEWRVQNLPVTVVPGSSVEVELSGFWPVPSRRQAWMRLALTDSPVPNDWDGSGSFNAGEIEDSLILRPVLDSAFDDDWAFDSDHRSRGREADQALTSINAMREVSLAHVAALAAVETQVLASVVDASIAAADASASASAASIAATAAEAHALAADASAASASISASSTASSSASVPCATASASASSSATASASASASAAASAQAVAVATAAASANATTHASAAAFALAAAEAEAASFAGAYAEAIAYADAVAFAYAEASASADARAEAWASAGAYADAYADAIALGIWADAFADAFAIAWADASVDVNAHAEATADALALALADSAALALVAIEAHSFASGAALAATDAVFAAAAAADFATSTATSASFGSDMSAIAAGAADAAASTDALALALASGDCEGETCAVWITTSSTLEAELDVCLSNATVGGGDLETCNAEAAGLEAELAGLGAEIDLLVDELDAVAADLQVCESSLGGPAVGPSTELVSMSLIGADPIPWLLPGNPVHLTVEDSAMYDAAFGSPGCCEVYDVTIECAD
ncbi:MAG: hypothetical protein GY898_21405 [Proteobacteria bacterium]|nr:hypothetical protein [Pseudomonadota bacterium]